MPEPREQSALGGGRFKLPVVASDCDATGVCLRLSCRLNTTLDVTAEGRIKFQHDTGRGRGETRQRHEANDDDLAELLADWLASTEVNCVRDLVLKHGAMERVAIGAALGISHELVSRDLLSAGQKLASSDEGQAFRELLLELVTARGNVGDVEPDHDVADAG